MALREPSGSAKFNNECPILKHLHLILATTFFASQISIKSKYIVTRRNVTFASGRLGNTLGK
jgi:hypothetical protein